MGARERGGTGWKVEMHFSVLLRNDAVGVFLTVLRYPIFKGLRPGAGNASSMEREPFSGQ